MTCPRPGEKCIEFMCGSSVDGICTEGILLNNNEYNKALDDFLKELDRIQNIYHIPEDKKQCNSYVSQTLYDIFRHFRRYANRLKEGEKNGDI